MMFWTVAVFLGLGVAEITRRIFRTMKPASLGWMSEQWLAEQRAVQMS